MSGNINFNKNEYVDSKLEGKVNKTDFTFNKHTQIVSGTLSSSMTITLTETQTNAIVALVGKAVKSDYTIMTESVSVEDVVTKDIFQDENTEGLFYDLYTILSSAKSTPLGADITLTMRISSTNVGTITLSGDGTFLIDTTSAITISSLEKFVGLEAMKEYVDYTFSPKTT